MSNEQDSQQTSDSGNEPLVTQEEINKQVKPSKTESSQKNMDLSKTNNSESKDARIQSQNGISGSHDVSSIIKKPSLGEKIRNFTNKIFSDKTSRTIAIAIIVTLIGSSSSYGYYAYQKKKIDKKVSQESESLLTDEAKDKLPEVQDEQQETVADTTTSEIPKTGEKKSSTPTSNSSNDNSSDSSSESSDSSSSPAPESQPTVSVNTINDSGVQTQKISSSNCYAYAPSGWTNVENAQAYAFGYDAYNSDQSLGASYLVTAVTVDPYGNYYQNATPEQFIETTMTTLQGWSNFSWIEGPWNLGSGYTVRIWKANKPGGQEVKAVAQWATWDLGDGTGSYVIALRMGSAVSGKWDQGYSSVVYDVATSVRCTAQVKANIGASQASDSSVSSGGTTSANDSGLSSDDKWREAMMGYENVYDSGTGEHYEAPLNSYNSTGPDGAGYYKQNGNDYTKLERGFGF